MVAIASVRDALKTQVQTISALSGYDTMPTEVILPAAIVYPSQGSFLTYNQTMDGAVDLEFIIVLLVSNAIDDIAQDELDGYLAPTGALSVKTAVEANPTLGGLVDYLTVGEARNYGIHEFGSVSYFGCEFVVSIGAM